MASGPFNTAVNYVQVQRRFALLAFTLLDILFRWSCQVRIAMIYIHYMYFTEYRLNLN